MNGLSCKTCRQLYCEKVLPRILTCGHSCCSSCLTRFLASSNKICPLCSKSLEYPDVDQYPINCSVLEVSEELSDTPYNHFRLRLESISEKHEQILTAVVNILDKKNKLTTMNLNKNKLLELVAKDDEDMNVKEVNATLDDIEVFMNDVARIFSCDCNPDYVSIDYFPSQFENSREFLIKIYEEIQNGGVVLAHKTIKGEDRYARISISSNTLLLHAFDTSEREEHAKLVKFVDVKNAFSEGEVCIFLSFTAVSGNWQRIYIECFSQSVLAYYFFKMCTGETGPTYLGCKYKKSNEYYRCIDRYECYAKITVNLDNKFQVEDKYLEYLSFRKNELICKRDQYYVQLSLSGSFEIFKNDQKTSNVIGTVINPEEINKFFADREFSKVQDCGIALTL